MSMTADPRAYVDFHKVPPHQREIDARLANWGRWSHNRGSGADCSPMFALYRSADPLRQYASASADPVDRIDAQYMQKAVGRLPSAHRQAVAWCYIRRNNPANAARTIGTSLAGLKKLIDDGRQMLINRGA